MMERHLTDIGKVELRLGLGLAHFSTLNTYVFLDSWIGNTNTSTQIPLDCVLPPLNFFFTGNIFSHFCIERHRRIMILPSPDSLSFRSICRSTQNGVHYGRKPPNSDAIPLLCTTKHNPVICDCTAWLERSTVAWLILAQTKSREGGNKFNIDYSFDGQWLLLVMLPTLYWHSIKTMYI